MPATYHDELNPFPDSRRRPPWFTILLFTGLFFAMLHDPFFSVNFLDKLSSADVAKIMLEGSTARKVVLIFLGFFASYILLGRNRYQLHLGNGILGWLLIGFAIWVFLSNTWGSDLKLTFKRSAVFILFSMGALGVALKFSLDDLIVFVLTSTLIYLVIGLGAEIVLHTFNPFNPDYRFCGTLHPNHSGTNCALLLFSVVFLREKLRRYNFFFITVALIAFAFMGLTKSRGSFASGVLALVALRTLTSPWSKKLLALWVVSMAFAIFIVAAGDRAMDYTRKGILLGRQTDVSSSAETLTGRTKLWKRCLAYASRRPILGYGWGGFWTPQLAERISGEQGWGIALGHSSYLDVLLTLGFMGLAVFIAILTISIWRSLVYYWVTGNQGYAFIFTVLVYGAVNGFLESAFVGQTYLGLIGLIGIIRLGLIEPPLAYYRLAEAEA